MSSDLATVRAEVKAWERSFKENNGRNPTIDDIKKQPAVAQRYKLYKKLSKTATGASSSDLRPNDPPSTPTRQTPSTSKPPPKLLLSASRLVETTAPLASYNPFSPQKKNKGKQRESIPFNLVKPTTNPFSSPRKSKLHASQREPSPDPFPLIEPSLPSTSTVLPPEPLSAVSRARKRLRGEPVSPSPNKEKRRRVLSPASLPFPKLQLQSSGNDSDDGGDDDDDEGEGDPDPDGGNSSFVDDSPMKPAANGKAFTFLFEEAVKPTSTSELFGDDVPAAKPQRAGQQPRSKLPSMDDDIFSEDPRSKGSVKKSSMKAGPSSKSQTSVLTKSRSKLVQSTLPFINKPSNDTRERSPSEPRTSAKRVLAETEHVHDDTPMDDDNSTPPLEEPPNSQLLPPSPNPHASRPTGKSKPNGARSSQPSKATGRKKAKLQDVDYNMTEDMKNDDGSSSDSLNRHHSVKLVHHSRGIRAALATEEGNAEIEDPIMSYARRVQPRGQGSTKQGRNSGTDVILGEDGSQGEDIVDDEKLESHLPTKLHRVLVLETLKSKQNDDEEEKIVKGLLSGRRLLHYDPKKGGEIWGVGEDERDELAGHEEQDVDEALDEWEGDPVPWEVGELSESYYHPEEL
ncbi:hypothetical protein NP233_g2047 [Leucocoprinus birnbaumii]|uniref:DNA replication regulator SLD2 n=1 Tax=Leucocoprinus birnbaumii TaxID=56174 RepID=A0AAD5W1H2_9AGAR|nr:hypothetical protein NP233_g2047 [Leucocoprinus birnbaumii]